jgi:hypothetical protein
MPINKKHYPPNWTEIRQRILARSGHHCEGCGCAEYTVGYRHNDGTLRALIIGKSYREACQLRQRMQQAMKRKLIVIRITVAHLDHDEWNHDVSDDRLAAYCEYCHLNYDRVDNAKRKRYGKQYARHQLSLI